MDGTTLPTAPDPGQGETLSWHLQGMDCASCVAKVERAVKRLPGISEVAVNLMAERLTLRRAPEGATAEAVERQVAALGYRVTRLTGTDAPDPAATSSSCCGGRSGKDREPHEDTAPILLDTGPVLAGNASAPAHAGHLDTHDADALDSPWWRTGKARLVLGLGALVGVAYLLSLALPRESYWIFLAATLIGVAPFGRRAIALARAGSPFSIETLMGVAALGAVAIGAAEEAAIVVLLFAIGELLEGVAADRARAGIKALADLMPRTARVERDGTLAEVQADTLRPGEVVQVRPGDRVPCDGLVLEGQSAVDESPVTGESVPVARGPGEAVVAGSVNTAALLRVRVARAATDNTVARIVRLVEEAAASRAPTQRFVERFAAWWTPAALGAALLVAIVPPLLFGEDWWTWIYRGLALLLIACPCALVISVPAAIASGLSAGARRGLLVKGGAALEAIGAAWTVAFDKTGTLTEGRPRVTDVIPLGALDEAGVLRLAAAVEQGSAHPLGRATLARAGELGLTLPPAGEARAVPGKAVEATIEGHRIAVGSPRHAAEAGSLLGTGPAAARAEALEAEGKTVVVVLADGGTALGLIALRDEPRPDAADGIGALKAMGVEAVMLTGDNERTGRAIAGKLGLDVRAELLPADKLREIDALKRCGPVVMVGDGINDAPALAAASVGVAMGGGTDVALETADAALLRERVAGVAELVGLSRSTLANVRQNVAIALGLKAVFLVTTLAGLTGLWPAILADTGATVLVTLNALRLLRWQPVRA